MSFRRSDGPADQAEYERLLDAARGGQPPSPGSDPLAQLLAAVAAPAGPGELPGEEQALAAFRATRANPPVTSARVPRRRFRVGVAAWAAGLTAVATAGVAMAAVSLDRPGVPAPASSSAGSAGPASAGAGRASAGSTAGGGPSSATGSADPSPIGGPSASGPSAVPEPTTPGRPAASGKLSGQCRAYLAKPVPERAKALRTPGFADLVAAAGGADQVADYCTRLVPEAAGQLSPNDHSSPAASAATPAQQANGRAVG
ncbi:hypothetical protein GA0074695_4441 [Micromonospora viridifaciens]|uniref:Uncharacterized protein n=1 Tax=Micromonospora viridifaciens TaxID=1881 RepID=A0A1C4YLX3_MICVI|nr:hypothetical protein [Micromonospora viridifaciens]SCF21729.1 hypothetical protein GA0074695_4441 [Micromonospora viridifaciens]